jgi:hypothetical protein
LADDDVTQWLLEEALTVGVEVREQRAEERAAALEEAHAKVAADLAGRH